MHVHVHVHVCGWMMALSVCEQEREWRIGWTRHPDESRDSRERCVRSSRATSTDSACRGPRAERPESPAREGVHLYHQFYLKTCAPPKRQERGGFIIASLHPQRFSRII